MATTSCLAPGTPGPGQQQTGHWLCCDRPRGLPQALLGCREQEEGGKMITEQSLGSSAACRRSVIFNCWLGFQTGTLRFVSSCLASSLSPKCTSFIPDLLSIQMSPLVPWTLNAFCLARTYLWFMCPLPLTLWSPELLAVLPVWLWLQTAPCCCFCLSDRKDALSLYTSVREGPWWTGSELIKGTRIPRLIWCLLQVSWAYVTLFRISRVDVKEFLPWEG